MFSFLLFCFVSESEPSLLEFKPFSNGPLVGGFVYRGCQSERLYGSYVFGDRNGYVSQCQFLVLVGTLPKPIQVYVPHKSHLGHANVITSLCYTTSGSLTEETLLERFFSRNSHFYGMTFKGKEVFAFISTVPFILNLIPKRVLRE